MLQNASITQTTKSKKQVRALGSRERMFWLMDQHAPDKRCLVWSKRKRHLAVQLQLPASLDTSINYSKWNWRYIRLI